MNLFKRDTYFSSKMPNKRFVCRFIIKTFPHILNNRNGVAHTKEVDHSVDYHLSDLYLLQFLVTVWLEMEGVAKNQVKACLAAPDPDLTVRSDGVGGAS